MRSNLGCAVLAARTGARRRSLDLVWAALSPAERAHLEREVDALDSDGVRAEWAGDTPLFYAGPLESIGPRVLAVCGARELRQDGVRLAERAARGAVAAGATVIAGDTEGAETAAVATALRHGGLAVSVLAEGIRQAPSRPEAGLVTVSPSAPDQPWSVDAAMARNATIARMCTALVAIGAGGTGATLDAGMRALAAGRQVLAVGATAGSRLLVDYGATAALDEVELTWWLDRVVAPPSPPVRSCAPAPGARLERRYAWPPLARHWSTA